MSILHIVCVLDLATEAFGRPFCVSHPAEAVRSFTDESNNPDAMICKHAKDYELWSIASFDDNTGEVSGKRQRLVRAIDTKRPTQE